MASPGAAFAGVVDGAGVRRESRGAASSSEKGLHISWGPIVRSVRRVSLPKGTLMIDRTRRIELGVVAMSRTPSVLRCRVGPRIVCIPAWYLLPGKEVRKPSDRGRLVLPLQLAEQLRILPLAKRRRAM